ncbi:hypothetical protein CHS0354_015556 [Potamilus streckersoni]|uniref:Tumor protein p53-inducible protein 11 n=1 Tax=Potamilus streckersoni TaxID=2493646 RepID=A0AAE0SV67_9BIVA|nr:hypothetical protein CHS0354_015556 [Potamilus streckersoni]
MMDNNGARTNSSCSAPREDIHQIKHSSGDLHSRLKTRKLLGVGETDDGDVHRSKLSQILGHSDQLYIRLPSGLRIWQIVLVLIFFAMALWALVFPSHYYLVMFETEVGESSYLPIRMYAIALFSLSLVYWKTLQTSDKDVIRIVLLSTAVFFTLQTIVLGIWWPPSASLSLCSILCQCCVLLVVFVTSYFYWITRTSKDWRQKEVRYYR